MDIDTLQRFAARRLAGLDLAEQAAFPVELWQSMAAEGLFRIGLPTACGGSGGGYGAIAAADRRIAAASGALGFAMSWTGHQLVARHFIEGFGNAEQTALWLPRLARGESTAAVAISEPGAGAHPRDLNTAASACDDGWSLSGEKAWVTNGPIADLLIVLAIIAREGDRKRYAAFLVPRTTPGLELLPMPELQALRPSQHCRLRLTDCRLPATAMLGAPGSAYETMALPFRDIEDAVGLSGTAGLCDFIVRRLAAILPPTDREVHAALGELAGLAALLGTAALALADHLDRNTAGENAALLVGARSLLQRFLDGLAELRRRAGSEDRSLATACSDLEFSTGIARGPRAVRQSRLGAALLRRQAP